MYCLQVFCMSVTQKLLPMDKDIIFSMVIATLLFLLMTCFIVTFWMIYQRRRAMHREEKKQLHVAYEKEVLHSRLEMKEQTLKHISEEIHDNISQILSLAKLNIGIMESNCPESLRERIGDTKQLISKVIQDLRDLSGSMDTDTITARGVYAAISAELDRIKKTGAYIVNFNSSGTVWRMDVSRELILFRIFQEVLNNLIKHASASVIDIDICYTATLCTLSIADNGKGFDITTLPESRGMGLRNMEKRSAMIGASLQLESNVLNGTLIRIVFTP